MKIKWYGVKRGLEWEIRLETFLNGERHFSAALIDPEFIKDSRYIKYIKKDVKYSMVEYLQGKYPS